MVEWLNPFSSEGQDTVREKGDLDNVFTRNNDLINIVAHSDHQNLSDDTLIPDSYGNLALKRIQWYIERKNNKDFKISDFAYLLNEEIAEADVISFHLLCQAIAIKFNLKSRESRLFIESQGKLIEDRLMKMMPQNRKEIVDKVLSQLILDDNFSWLYLKDLIASKKLSLEDLVIDNGEIIINREDFVAKFGDEFKDRAPDRMYDIIIGENIKELLLTSLIMQNTEDYIEKIKEMSSKVEIHPAISELGEKIATTITEISRKYSNYYGRIGEESLKIGNLQREAFPPCMAKTVEGVTSGGRNDAIVLMLTSFVSYARLFPGIFISGQEVKVSDIDPNLTITLNEILPIIYEAADNCSPPLFEDQPQERLNIISKLGFGMNTYPKLENEGETKWYTPMSCEKIKMHLPQLCRPDKLCKNVVNPLFYYSRRKWEMEREGKLKETQTDDTSDN
ncbi:DNA primase large subunit [Methanobrevibacter cuticularis]|uniref:DNA primase large subunit PriL n=1 Tax=Methanobrevibacter cuticularis TaxID=47311 RepID=A0A166D8W6_9EURY|nr:DNA primase large subunit PriL [Methanobrevibacter cuticularis]KZX15330.1 DNA primase large subunit [Methanobrevibacter cuticularis]